MKRLVAAVAVLVLGLPARAQVTLTTYYVIPPTNGCDGLGAFGPASALNPGGCTAPYLYEVIPSGCAESPWGWPPFWVSNDTVYTNLCSTPCSITMWDSGGLPCVILCQLPGGLGLSTDAAGQEVGLRVSANPVSAAGGPVELKLRGEGPVTVSVTDGLGRVLFATMAPSGTTLLPTTGMRPGIHFVHAWWPDGRSATLRLVLQ